MTMKKPSTGQVIKSVILTSIGAAPGTIWFINAHTTQAVVIACLGTFIGFALSLPGVSAARVAGGVAGSIVAHNVPRSMQKRVFDAFLPDELLAKEEPPKENNGDSKPAT